MKTIKFDSHIPISDQLQIGDLVTLKKDAYRFDHDILISWQGKKVKIIDFACGGFRLRSIHLKNNKTLLFYTFSSVIHKSSGIERK